MSDRQGSPNFLKRARSNSCSSFEDFPIIGNDELVALEKLEEKFSQMSSPSSKRRRISPPIPKPSAVAKNSISAVAQSESNKIGPEDASNDGLWKEAKSSISTSLFTSGAKLAEIDHLSKTPANGSLSRSPSPEFEQESDLSSWFTSNNEASTSFVSFVRPSISGAPVKILQPSAAALEAAKKRLEDWDEDEDPLGDEPVEEQIGSNRPFKPILPTMTPKMVSKTKEVPLKPQVPLFVKPSLAPATPLPSLSSRAYVFHPSHPESKLKDLKSVEPIILPPMTLSTPQRPSSTTVTTPQSIPKHLGMRSRPRGPPRAKFSTPWKQGAIPTPETSILQPNNRPTPIPPKRQPLTKVVVEPKRDPNSVFNLVMQEKRTPLKDLPLPTRHRDIDLESFGISASVGDIDTWNAQYWAFEENGSPRDVHSAFRAMKERGCDLVTEPWVQNHWIWIIWKLANTVVLWPKEQGERWSFQEVLRQLLYRYEREINQCQRPAIRLIQERDASPSSAMVLCVFDIIWPTEGGKEVEGSCPELVLTDGWYKIRAMCDSALARAARRGKIRIGAKIGCINAKLDARRKDAEEVLKSFDSSSIIITGNSAHLVPWHTKLGFQRHPFIATLNSLTPDGGVIPSLFLVIYNAFPVSYVETIGNERTERDENEESEVQHAWQKKRADEEMRLREEKYKTIEKTEGIIDRLERISGSTLNPGSDDCAPDDIESKVDELEDHEEPKEFLKQLDSITAGWMAIAMRQRLSRGKETMLDDINSELADSFPPRNVRSVRVLVVKDALTSRRAPLRTAQITVWDAKELGDTLQEGKTYMVANLVPTVPKAWGKNGKEGQVFLITRRDTRWKRCH